MVDVLRRARELRIAGYPVTIEALGGPEALRAAAPAELGGPDAHAVVAALAHAWAEGGENWPLEIALGILREASDPIGFEASVLEIAQAPEFADALGNHLGEVLVARAGRRDNEQQAHIAGAALQHAVAALSAESAEPLLRLRVVALIGSVGPGEDGPFAVDAARAAGAAHDAWAEDALRAGLRDGLKRLSAHDFAAEDALVELAHARLLVALDADAESEVLGGLAEAEAMFNAVLERDSERVDARLHAAALRAVRAVAQGGSADVVKQSTAIARDCIAERSAYGREKSRGPLSRRGAEAHWWALCELLDQVAPQLSTDVWLNAGQVLPLMLEALELSRSQQIAPFGAASLEKVIAPTIAAPFVRSSHARAQLARLLEDDATELSIEQREIALALLRDAEPAPPKAASPEEAIEALLGADAAATLETTLGPELYERLIDRLAALEAAASLERSRQWFEVFVRVMDALEKSPDYVGDTKNRINELVVALIDFVASRIEVERAGAQGRFAYLTKPDAKEDEMARDLVEHLQARFGTLVQTEVRGIGTGRIDILVKWGIDEFVIECKRDAKPVAAHALDPYLTQTQLYLGTRMRIAGLAVLDLADKSTGARRTVESSVWVVVREGADETESNRHIVCLLIPGNSSATPSQVGKNEAAEARKAERAARGARASKP